LDYEYTLVRYISPSKSTYNSFAFMVQFDTRFVNIVCEDNRLATTT